ncbi:MAG TPA: hypothetical protein VGY53_07365, partial [Isosphaeraceae bacterium]|nr:hypothetical protein [Isosphaeraceae bacterium]
MHDKLAALVALGKHLGMFVQPTRKPNVHYFAARMPRHAATGGMGTPRFSRRVLPAYAVRNKPRRWSSGTT